MTIDEEIKHQEEISNRYARMSEYERNEGNEGIAKDCAQCAADHAQLAEWLTELKEFKAADTMKIKDLIKFKVFQGAEFRTEMGEKIIDGDMKIGDITDIGVIEEIYDRNGIKLPHYHAVVYISLKR